MTQKELSAHVTYNNHNKKCFDNDLLYNQTCSKNILIKFKAKSLPRMSHSVDERN